MASGRIMGLDVGDKWIGVALSDESQLLSRPESPIRRSGWPQDVDAILSVARAWQIQQIVVGLPLNMNHTVGPQAEKTLRFGKRVEAAFEGEVVFWDERLTTQMAERLLIEQNVRRQDRRQVVDGMAAALILQSYLDHLRMRPGKEDRTMANEKDTQGSVPEEDDEVIVLTDEDGQEHEFVVVDVIEVESQQYAILLPIDTEDDEEAEAVILRLDKDSDGEDTLSDIESEEEWERVAQAYEQLLDEDTEEE